MDLRKSVLKRQNATLQESFQNESNVSMYESAAEDGDTTLYYSFTDESLKINVSSTAEVGRNSSMFSEADKENTMIQRHSIPAEKTLVNDSNAEDSLSNDAFGTPKIQIQIQSLEIPIRNSPEIIAQSSLHAAIIGTEPENPDQEKTEVTTNEPEIIVTREPADSIDAITPPENMEEISFTEAVADVQANAEQLSLEPANVPITEPRQIIDLQINDVPIAEIPNEDLLMEIAEDPNKDIPNPFISLPIAEDSSLNETQNTRMKRRSVVPSKIPSKNLLYSPVIRRSIDRRAKAPASRRTIVHDSNQPGPSRGSGHAKTPTAIPKPVTTKAKPRLEPQKTFRVAASTIAKPSFVCKWCDKKFQLENALTNHHAESCLKIPAIEKRKVTATRDKQQRDRRRTTVFAPPMTKRKSPMRRPVADMNKSGVKITPKKSIKCHLCPTIFNDAVSLAEHILTHKYNREQGNQ